MRLNDMTVKSEKLREHATAGFEAFEAKVLFMTKKDIFNKAYEINAKNEIYGYLCACATEDLDEKHIDVLLKLGENVIETLYDYFLGKDYASIMFYSEITEWVEDFCQGVLKGEI